MDDVTDVPQASVQTYTIPWGPTLTSNTDHSNEHCIVKLQNPSMESARMQSSLRLGLSTSASIDVQDDELFGQGIPAKDQRSTAVAPLFAASDDQAPSNNKQHMATSNLQNEPITSPPSAASEALTTVCTAYCKSVDLVNTNHRLGALADNGEGGPLTEYQGDPCDAEDHLQLVDLHDDAFPSSSLPPSSSPAEVFSSSPFCSSQSSIVNFGNKGGDDAKVLAKEVDNISSESQWPEVDPTDKIEQRQGRCLPFPREKVVVVSGISAENEDLGRVDLNSDRDKEDASNHLPPSHPLCPPLTESLGQKLNGISMKRVGHMQTASPPSKRFKSRADYSPPAPRRSTLAFQQRQFRKLTAPFRPPLRRPIDDVPQLAKREQSFGPGPSTESMQDDTPPRAKSATVTTARRSKAAAQFKSPVLGSDISTDSRCTFRLTPAIQTLERKLQLLKRAVKVKENKEEEVLSRLAKKWTNAGREVAYELWDLVKDAGTPKTLGSGRSWGWDNAKEFETSTNWGWDTTTPADNEAYVSTGYLDDIEDDDNRLPTLGTMLRDHGIAVEVLGWDDESETFHD